MDIATAERALARQVAQLGGLELDKTVRCGDNGALPEATPLVTVRFTSGTTAGTELAEFAAEVRAFFAEPKEASDFAAAVWGALPLYGAAGFTELAAEGRIEFAEQNGYFTTAGRIRACFA